MPYSTPSSLKTESDLTCTRRRTVKHFWVNPHFVRVVQTLYSETAIHPSFTSAAEAICKTISSRWDLSNSEGLTAASLNNVTWEVFKTAMHTSALSEHLTPLFPNLHVFHQMPCTRGQAQADIILATVLPRLESVLAPVVVIEVGDDFEQKVMELFGYVTNCFCLMENHPEWLILGVLLGKNSPGFEIYGYYRDFKPDEPNRVFISQVVLYKEDGALKLARALAALLQFVEDMCTNSPSAVSSDLLPQPFFDFESGLGVQVEKRGHAAILTDSHGTKRVLKLIDQRYPTSGRTLYQINPSLYPNAEVLLTDAASLAGPGLQSAKMCLFSYPYIEGSHLATLGKQFVDLGLQLAQLHDSKGVVHGDVRESNAVFTPSREGVAATAVLIDFDFAGPASTTFYPRQLNRDIGDGARHPGAHGGRALLPAHDWFSLASVMELYAPQAEDQLSAWGAAVARLSELARQTPAVGSQAFLDCLLPLTTFALRRREPLPIDQATNSRESYAESRPHKRKRSLRS